MVDKVEDEEEDAAAVGDNADVDAAEGHTEDKGARTAKCGVESARKQRR